MAFASAPHHHSPDTQWPVRRAMVLWLGASAAVWIPLLFGAYWLLGR